jgi:DNA polymerase III delta prime subunit
MDLHPPSEEQIQISNALATSNIIVDAVAGSGKTTTVLHLARTYLYESILLLTYNKKLRLETKARVEALGLTNVDVHNYHSWAVKYYDHSAHTDTALKKHLVKQTKLPYSYTVIIIDEAQDMTPLYYKLVCKVLKENLSKPKIVVLGDRFQSIYDFNKADSRFIIYADKLFGFANSYPWINLKLGQTFRVPDKITNFLNTCVLKSDRLTPFRKTELKPIYLYCDAYGSRVYTEIKSILALGYGFSDIFVLAPSVRSDKSPIKVLANALSHSGIPIYVPVSDDEKLDEQVMEGKIVFSSFHQVKGLERKVILVYSFDNGYFMYFNKTDSPYKCSNTLYVATTRALEQLVLIHHYESKPLLFIPLDKLNQMASIETLGQARSKKSLGLHILNQFRHLDPSTKLTDKPPGSDLTILEQLVRLCSNDKKIPTQEISVTDLCKNIPFDVIEQALSYLTIQTITKPSKGSKITLPLKSKQSGLFESVSEITGIAIPAYFEIINTGSMQIYRTLKLAHITNPNSDPFEEYDCSDDSDDQIQISKTKARSRMDWITELDLKQIDTSKLLELSNIYNCWTNKLVHKVNQITSYNWLDDESLCKCVGRLTELISPESKFEIRVALKGPKELYSRMVTGWIDCIDPNEKNIWEFKCVGELESKHILQTAIYMYLYYNKMDIVPHTKSYEHIQLEKSRTKIRSMINQISSLDVLNFSTHLPDSDIKLSNKYILSRLSAQLDETNSQIDKRIDIGYSFYLYNILSKAQIKISAHMEDLVQMMDSLMYYKFYSGTTKTSDEEFFKACVEAKDSNN